MSGPIITKFCGAPPRREWEIRRYAGYRTETPETETLRDTCWSEAAPQLQYRVCYRVCTVSVTGDLCDFGAFQFQSEKLANNLRGCKRAVVFAATVGIGLDRLIAKYGRLSPSKALMLQAIGAERIEALCDAFCAELAAELHCKFRPRFSPGYGDFPITAQKELFAVLDCTRQIGVTLNDSLLMSPTKSVTAIVGITDE